MDKEIAKAVYTMAGELKATNKSIDEKFATLFSKIEEMKKEDIEMKEKISKNSKDINVIKINWQWVTRIAGTVGSLASIITTGLITLVAKMIG